MATMTSDGGSKTKRRDPVRDCKPPDTMSEPERIAFVLDWAAEHLPGVFLQYNVILRVCRRLPSTPRMGNQEVGVFKTKFHRASDILRTRYNRLQVTQTGIGVRASFDDADATRNALPPKLKRLASAKRSVLVTLDAIDPAKLPSTADMAPWKKWLTTDVRDVMRAISSPGFDQKCLPPSAEEDAKKEK